MQHIHHSPTTAHPVPSTSGRHFIGETLLILPALLLTIVEISCKLLLFLLSTTSRLVFYGTCAVLLATVFVFMYCILLGISLAGGPGLPGNIS